MKEKNFCGCMHHYNVMSTTKQKKTVEPAAEYKTDIQLKLINLIK